MNSIYDPDFVKTLFNQMSSSYERMNYVTSFGFSIRWRKQFLQKLGKSEQPIKVIDLLSGLGENWSFLKQNFPNAQFSALDFSEEMVLQSQEKGQRIFSGTLELLCQDVLNNTLDSNAFDVVSCAYGLKTFSDEQLDVLAKEVHRILKPNGKFSFVEVSKPKSTFLYFFYAFYLGKIIPILGKIFLGNPNDYKMLWIYTEKFGNTERVKPIFERHSLSVKIDHYFGGCATGISGKKLES